MKEKNTPRRIEKGSRLKVKSSQTNKSAEKVEKIFTSRFIVQELYHIDQPISLHYNGDEMAAYQCPICESYNDIPDSMKEGERLTCLNCSAQLVLTIGEGIKKLRCAFCTKDLVECTPDCETRILERNKKGFFDINL